MELQRIRLLQPLQFPGEVLPAAAAAAAAGGVFPPPAESGSFCVLSEHLGAPERREKITCELQTQQVAYSQDGGRADGEPDPGGDIELELCALDVADSEIAAQVVELEDQ